jgi:hypothetical protein
MASFREGKIVSLEESTASIVRARVDIGSSVVAAVAHPEMIGALREGDRVIVNTTGLELDLGTGGTGFILWNLDGEPVEDSTTAHIMKLRYTPWQMNVMAVESPESPDHDAMVDARALNGTPVVACALHSQVPAAAAGLKVEVPDAKLGYLMTDGGALPLAFSRLVSTMQKEGLIDVTCTSGHAFGGDLESVNVFSGLVALHEVSGCDAVIVALGPGIVGTGTALGHTGLEQGQILDAATSLGGDAIAALRIGFDDERPRHRGISHHSISALTVAARERATVVVPKLAPPKAREIEEQLVGSPVCERHDVVIADGRPGVRSLLERDINPASMGRPMTESPDLFLAAAAAGAVAGERLKARG